MNKDEVVNALEDMTEGYIGTLADNLKDLIEEIKRDSEVDEQKKRFAEYVESNFIFEMNTVTCEVCYSYTESGYAKNIIHDEGCIVNEAIMYLEDLGGNNEM